MTESVSSLTNNYGASYSTTDSSSASNLKDEFLTLLVEQLKAQNPLEPQSNQDFSAQLAQFSQLEQLSDIRTLMEEQVQTNLVLTQTIADSALPGLLGKSAKAISNKSHYDSDNAMPIGYTLPFQASSAELTIYNETGSVVKKIPLTDFELSNGDHNISWDGTNDDGDDMPAGDYYFSVNATSGDGSTYNADTFTYGTIQSIKFTNEGTKLLIGGVEIPLGSVVDISTNV